MYFCHFYTLKPMDFARTYCFMIFTQILLNFHDIGSFLCKPIFLMEGRQNVWSPWYLMPQDKPCKVEYKFCNNVISHCKDKMFFPFGLLI